MVCIATGKLHRFAPVGSKCPIGVGCYVRWSARLPTSIAAVLSSTVTRSGSCPNSDHPDSPRPETQPHPPSLSSPTSPKHAKATHDRFRETKKTIGNCARKPSPSLSDHLHPLASFTLCAPNTSVTPNTIHVPLPVNSKPPIFPPYFTISRRGNTFWVDGRLHFFYPLFRRSLHGYTATEKQR